MEYRRWAWVEVDLAAISANVRALKGLTAPGTKFMAVVKADAYGHGAVPVARAAVAAGADWLGVATLEEAVELRQDSVEAPILVMVEPPPSAAPLLIEHGVTPALCTRPFAEALAEAAASSGVSAPFHLKVDTGMNRLGVRAEEAVDFAVWLRDTSDLRMEGVFTHFATAEIPGDWEMGRQLERFVKTVDDLKTERISPGLLHAANSAATILDPATHFDMVRCGISLYGLHPGSATRDQISLMPAMSVKARVSYVKRVQMGEGVSYGFTWRASAPTTVVTLPLGYADGVHRLLSDRMRVLIRGMACTQVGRVCMDQLMVEVPEGLGVSIGDEVILVGEQDEEAISMDEVADGAETINYEMACAFSRRMRREYA